METKNEKNIATYTHLSALGQYFIPFGNYIFPILFWNSKKNTSEYVDFHGKQVLNFQLSLLVYSLALGLIAIPVFIFTVFKNISFDSFDTDCEFIFQNLNLENNIGILTLGLIAVLIFIGLKTVEFFLIIYASIKASNGEKYKYPFTISFIK